MSKICRFLCSTLLIVTIASGCTLAPAPQTGSQQQPEPVISPAVEQRLEVKEPAAARLPEKIDPAEFTRLVTNAAIQIVDVREPEEFAKGHIPESINIFDEDFIFKPQESIAKLATGRRVVLVCATGARCASSYYAILAAPAPGYPNQGRLQYLDARVSYMADGSFTIDR